MTLADKIARTFRAYDVRGTYGQELDEEIARSLGWGIARYLARDGQRGAIAVCRDVRLSSPVLAGALTDGLTESGLDVLDLGQGPTPLLYYAAKTADVAGGVMVTGSHNPPEQNGFKVWLGTGNVFGDVLAEIGALALEGRPEVDGAGSVTTQDLSTAYRAEVLRSVGALAEQHRSLRIAVDCGNGTAGPLVVPLLEALGCEVIALFAQPDGAFPNHHPDPTVPAYLADLRDAVRSHQCNLGVAFDGDADRLGALDESGEIVFADRLLYLFGKEVAKNRPGAKVIGDVKCSDVVFRGLAEAGADAIMSRTGHSFIKRRIRDEQAALAGEMSGHFFFADRYLGYDDAIYAACRLAALLAHRGQSLAEALVELPATHSTPELRLPCPDDRKQAVLGALEATVDARADACAADDGPRRIDKTDGLRLSFDDGWCLVRASNTEAILVLRFDGETDQALARIEEFFTDCLAEAAPHLVAPLGGLLEVRV